MASADPQTSVAATEPAVAEGRVARNRRRRTDAFLAAGLRIVTEDGIEALTMARLAAELDTAPGAVYRYFASKADLMAAIEANAIGQLQRSHDETVESLAVKVDAEVDDDPALVRLVVLGRWFCAAARSHPEEVRLLQLVSARRATTLTPEGARGIAPSVLTLLGAVAVTIETAIDGGVIRPGDPLARAILWLMAFGGVSAADDLEEYLPDVLGGGRLARQLNVDLLLGWGADPDAIERIEGVVDRLGDGEALAADG